MLKDFQIFAKYFLYIKYRDKYTKFIKVTSMHVENSAINIVLF